MDGIDYFSTQSVQMPQNVPFMIEKMQQLEVVEMHSHEFLEIVFVASGTAHHRHIDSRTNQEYTNDLIPGDIFSIHTHERHCYENCKNLVLYNLFILPEFFEKYPNLSKLEGYNLLLGERNELPRTVMHVPSNLMANISVSLDRAIKEFQLQLPCFDSLVIALAIDFLITAMRSKEVNYREVGSDRKILLKTISMLEENYAEQFTLNQLAKVGYMSVSSYTKKFRMALGMSPMDYLMKIRLSKAKELLTTTELSITHIADKCGFCTPNYFIKLFHREYQITPLQYRKKER
ncbi:MAG: helix-turn-helix domain-containing protein [Lentisphaeria bacterium]|nr:helix-turn-helix domain-containing protein [Lentisphaeria bacterium]